VTDTSRVTSRVTAADLPDLLPLVRAYCDFYDVAPADDALLAVSRALIADPDREGVQLIARSESGDAVGFATVYWSWDTLVAAPVGIMHDLFVIPPARGTGIADLLIEECVEECRRHGAAKLGWQTAPDNTRARRVYERVGARKDEWVDYWLSVSPAAS
jgi:GNAT superfamily N-acetyltransferase